MFPSTSFMYIYIIKYFQQLILTTNKYFDMSNIHELYTIFLVNSYFMLLNSREFEI